nr:glycosyltransferase [uncultured Oscillibacter sp.]
MNILVLTNYQLYGDSSSSFVHQQARAYASLGHNVRVLVYTAFGRRICTGERMLVPLKKRTVDSVELIFMGYFSLSNFGENTFNPLSASLSLKIFYSAVAETFRPNVIHAHTLGPACCALGSYLKKKTGAPLVVTTHGSDVSIPVEQGRTRLLKPLCDHADAVVAVSSALAEKVRSCGTKTPVNVILNGFQISGVPSTASPRGCSLLQAGHLQEQKRVHVTIRAFARLYKLRRDAALTIIGQGPDRASLEKLCRESGVSGAVRFTGQLPNQEVLREMSHTQFFIMPSVREGFGIVYLEAMACGCVTVGTEGEGIADLIVSGENGFLVPPDDPEAIVRVIEWCLEHPAEAGAIAERGRRDALELTWEKNAKQYLKLFKEL